MLNRTIAPAIKDAIDFDLQLKPYEKFVLDNGTEVYAVDAGAEEVLQIEWVFNAGNWHEDAPMLAIAANNLLKNGTTTKNAFAINEHFEYYGAYLNRHCFNETANLNLHCLSRYAAELLPVVAELLNETNYPEEELQLYKQNSKQRLVVNLKKSEFVAGRLIDVYLFGSDHPYGKYSTAEGYEALTQHQLQSYFNRFYRNSKCIIFVAGRLPKNIHALLNQHFGQTNISNILPEKNYSPEPAAEKKHRVINDADAVQGAIRMGRLFPNRHHPDYTKATVLNTLFGGFFGSRLMANIREDKGYTYGIYSYLQNHRQQNAWIISTEAGRDVSEATVTEVYKEMELLRNQPVTEEELLLVKNYMLGTVLGDLDGPFQIIAKWKNIILNNLPADYFHTSVETIKSMSVKELQELANKYFIPEDFYELVVI